MFDKKELEILEALEKDVAVKSVEAEEETVMANLAVFPCLAPEFGRSSGDEKESA